MRAMSSNDTSVSPKPGRVRARGASFSLRVRRASSAGVCVLVPRSGEAIREK